MHYEALTKEGKRVYNFLDKFNMYILAGGTALALHIGHRVSVDFDFCSQDDIEKSLFVKVKKVFAEYSISTSIDNKDELTFMVNSVKVTFLKYPFKQIYKTEKIEGLELYSVKEIALMKAYAIGRRGSYKDYVDLCLILRDKYISLEEIIEKCSLKYGDAFNSRLFLEQLVYLDDVESVNILFLKEPISREYIKNFFENEVSVFKSKLQ